MGRKMAKATKNIKNNNKKHHNKLNNSDKELKKSFLKSNWKIIFAQQTETVNTLSWN